MANHTSTRTTQLYDRHADEIHPIIDPSTRPQWADLNAFAKSPGTERVVCVN